MSNNRKVMIYGHRQVGYRISDAAQYSFYFAGHTRSKQEEALKVVEERHAARSMQLARPIIG